MFAHRVTVIDIYIYNSYRAWKKERKKEGRSLRPTIDRGDLAARVKTQFSGRLTSRRAAVESPLLLLFIEPFREMRSIGKRRKENASAVIAMHTFPASILHFRSGGRRASEAHGARSTSRDSPAPQYRTAVLFLIFKDSKSRNVSRSRPRGKSRENVCHFYVRLRRGKCELPSRISLALHGKKLRLLCRRISRSHRGSLSPLRSAAILSLVTIIIRSFLCSAACLFLTASAAFPEFTRFEIRQMAFSTRTNGRATCESTVMLIHLCSKSKGDFYFTSIRT